MRTHSLLGFLVLEPGHRLRDSRHAVLAERCRQAVEHSESDRRSDYRSHHRGTRSGQIGTFGGGYIGHAVGQHGRRWRRFHIAGAVGAVAGAIVGQKAEKTATQKRAWEILVELEGGTEQLAIVQPADQNFSTGEKVRVYTRSDGSARVAKL